VGIRLEARCAGAALTDSTFEPTSETIIAIDINETAVARRTRCICNVLPAPMQNTRFVAEDDLEPLLMLLMYRLGAVRP
jgi:hypothetical protein